ncbi:MAG: hypothetical protein ACRD5G_05255 [Candidatus Acidiferrales bacterium]
MAEDDDIKDVMEEDRHRGRQRYDVAAHDKRRALLRAYRELLRESDEEAFRQYVQKHLGFAEGSEQFDAVLSAWREAQRRKS